MTQTRLKRALIVLAGILFGQVVLYAPSLVGKKILLPLDILTQPNVFIPRTPEIEKVQVQDLTLADWDFVYEPNRRFEIAELQAGRVPMWAPFEFSGVPFIWPKFSPFLLIECCAKTPVILAWGQAIVALVAGVGAFLFFRRVLEVSFWPAAIGAWCYPLTGFFIFWQGCPTGLPVVWLPWLLLAAARTVRHPGVLTVVALAAATCLVLISGFLDVAGQVLLGSGLFGLWLCFTARRSKSLGQSQLGDGPPTPALSPSGGEMERQPVRAGLMSKRIAALATGWTLGFLLAAPYLLPVLEYTQTGGRMARRGAGQEERPPVGLSALPQVFLPDMYGSNQRESARFVKGPQQESSAAAYAGVLAALLVAPLAFFGRRHRALNVFWAGLCLFALSWCLNLPGFVNLLRLPGLNMISHNRMVFLASFAILALAVAGLEALSQGLVSWRRWLLVPSVILAFLCIWCVYRSIQLPEAIRTQFVELVSQGKQIAGVHDLEGVKRAQSWFVQYYAASAIWCGLGVLGWLGLRRFKSRQARFVPIYGGLMVLDLLWFGYGRNVQSDPRLYFPSVPVLQAVAEAELGRIMGYGCLPASVSSICGLWDVRGYDAVDPARMVELIKTAGAPDSRQPEFAATIQLKPKAIITPAGDIRVPPVLDMLSVRYVILRGAPPTNACPAFKGTDYWALRNPAAMPRVYVPQRVELVADKATRLQRLASPTFNPREVAYVEAAVDLPASCHGSAEIREEIPTRVSVAARMETPGLVVLADRWDSGWRAYLDGTPATILCANHAIRGVVVPAGAHEIQFRYEPASFAWGLRLAAMAVAILLLLTAITIWRRGLERPSPAGKCPLASASGV